MPDHQKLAVTPARIATRIAEALASEPDGALVGVAISGAGPAVLALALQDFEAVGERIASCFRSRGIHTSVRVLGVDRVGRTVYGKDEG